MTNGDLAEPLGYGPVYARGNSNEWSDRSGNSPMQQLGAMAFGADMMSRAHEAIGQGLMDRINAYGPDEQVPMHLQVAATAWAFTKDEPILAGFAMGGRLGRAGRSPRGGACFVAGTEVSTTSGEVPIEEVEAGDVVVAAASTDGGEEAWVEVESAPAKERGAWVPRGVCSRLAKAGRKAVLPAMLAACDPASVAVELPSDVAVVQVYDARTGAWEMGLVGELEVGDEVLHEGHLLRVTSDGVEDRGFAEVGQLSEADATWTVDGVGSVPDVHDWVLVLGDDVDAGHWRLQDLTVGERFAFGGRVFESDVVDGELAARATGDLLGRVVDTFVRTVPEVIDAEIAYANGRTDVLTGTPNHPFWVDAVRDYVPLGELEVGTVLHVQGGGEAILVSKTWRQGDFEVFDFEVEGLHNFYVRGEGSGAAGVLVHNSSLPPGGSVRNVNPTGGKLNCGNCAVATDATLAGRPASALPGGLTSLGEMAGAFGKSAGSFIPTKGAAGATKIMEGWGAGSRGVMYGLREDGTAHFFNVVNQKGTVRFLDGQAGGAAKTDGFVKTMLLRTDNAKTGP